jgi:hypothetical protein
MPTKGPIANGGLLAGAGQLVGRESELNLLKLFLSNGTNCQIVGPRGVGKTALVISISRVTVISGQTVKFAYLDLTDAKCHSLRGFLDAIVAAWGIRTPVDSLGDIGPIVQQWRRSNMHPILGLDEFEEIASRPEIFNLDFFLDLRGLSNPLGMTIVSTSEKYLSELLPQYLPTSPFFNSFATLYLGPLSKDAAEDYLIMHQPPTTPLSAQEKQAIIDFSKGYPLRLQLAFSTLVQAKERGEGTEPALRSAEAAVAGLLTPSRPQK